MKKTLILLLLAINGALCAQEFTDLTGDYLGQTPPGDTPVVFAPGIVSTDGCEHSIPVFSPDGNEVFWWAGDVKTMKRIGDRWTSPTVTTYRGSLSYSIDGKRLYFTRTGPYPDHPSFGYYIEKQGNIWSEPSNIGILPRFSELKAICALSISQNGTLYFQGDTVGMLRNADQRTYRSKLLNGEYTKPELLPPSISLESGHPFIAPDEDYLIFSSDRTGNLGRGDLYISFHNLSTDTWSEPMNMGRPINTSSCERYAGLSHDGKYLFFTRRVEGPGFNFDIFWIRTDAVLPVPNGTVFNATLGTRFSSIETAIRLAQSGDTIIVEPGVYQESITFDKDVTLQSVDPNDPYYIGGTIIQGDPNEPVITLNNNTEACTIAGLTLRTGSVGVSGAATNATFHNCRIMDNVNHGMDLIGSSPLLSHCLITANGKCGIAMQVRPASPGRGGLPEIPCEPLIENCYIVDNNNLSLVGGQPVVVESLIQ
ncbi:right-handed parallel beta-helix repeat-containing protein [Planctomycetota bacterium]